MIRYGQYKSFVIRDAYVNPVTKRCQEITALFAEGLTVKEAAEAIGMPLGSFKHFCRRYDQ